MGFALARTVVTGIALAFAAPVFASQQFGFPAGAVHQTRRSNLAQRIDEARAPASTTTQTPQFVYAPTCGGSTPTPLNVSGTTGPIADLGLTTFTAVVSGAGPSLWDVDLATAIQHPRNYDLIIKLRSPAGTTVTISSQNGPSNVFNGTLWDDNTNDPVTDHILMNGSVPPLLSPEGRLSAFRGEDPNGTWTLSIQDVLTPSVGSLDSWSLSITSTLLAPPPSTSTTFSSSPATWFQGTIVNDSIVASGLGTSISKITVYAEITHTYSSLMDISLISPTGTEVKLSTRNGGIWDNVFNGTLFSPTALVPVTDPVYANMVVVPLVSPEGSFDNFIGQDPNGTWTLKIRDFSMWDFGTLKRWDLTVSTCDASLPAVYCTAGTTTNNCVAAISASNHPNVAHSNSVLIHVANVEGQKQGLIFYGLAPAATQWCTGGASLMCVKAPTERTPSLTSGGTLNACDGAFLLDWNAHQLANPTSLGNPWSVGTTTYVQAWFRDPPACKTTHLSNGVELTYQP
ncbi:MAG: proprotein convertase P-domain-containing protein [Planctomycetaceae bacterium]|nr:proprotein convertase P-domain-containing protein [Planctomycetaceae bacterium]